MIENNRPKFRAVSLSEKSFSSAAKLDAGSDETQCDCDTDVPCSCDEGPQPCDSHTPCDAYEIPNPPWPPCSAQCVDQTDTPPCDCVDQSDTRPLRSSVNGHGRQQLSRGKTNAQTFFKIAGT